MSYTSNILTGIEQTLRASTAFAYANIYSREELGGDEFPDAPQNVNLYLVPLTIKPNDQPDAQKFQVHAIEVTIVFPEGARATDENERDVVTEKKGEYHDAVVTALRLNMPNSTYPISNVFQVDYMGADYFAKPPDDYEETDDADVLHRVRLKWDYHTYES
jgi:hypothetical protein